jgi:hypothetical protein
MRLSMHGFCGRLSVGLRASAAVSLLAFGAGCSQEPASVLPPEVATSEPSDAGADGSNDASGDAQPDASAPIILSFGTSSTSMTEGESVTFTAVVTDPNGIDDLIGGTLKSADGQATYGAFATGAQEGAYSLSLSWSQLHATTPINFDQELLLTFVASFFDQAGHQTTASATIRLHCAGDAACDGVCIDLKSDAQNCGACGRLCDSPCDQGRCNGRAPCFPVTASTTCAAHCATLGSACGDCSNAAIAWATEAECDSSSPINYTTFEGCGTELWSGSDSWAMCCCTP